MAVIKIYNDIQTEDEKAESRFWGLSEGICFKDIDEFCESIPEDDNEIEVRLHCSGGSCIEGWSIYDRLRATGKEITCIVEGNAASMATVILMSAPKERRKAYNGAQICVHNPWVPGWCLDNVLTADDLKKHENALREQQEKILNLYVERCGCDKEEMQALMNEDKYIGVEEAKQLGLIGEVIAPISARKQNRVLNNKKQEQMKKKKDEKVEVKASVLNRVLAKLGLTSIEEFAKGMELSATDGTVLTIEREEGEPQVGDVASPDGEFVMPDGKTIVVGNGVITEIKEDSKGAKNEGEDEQTRIEELEKEVEELKERIAELEKENETAKANAKTTEDLRILNAVKIAGGEKALAKISSNYKPDGRKPDGSKAKTTAEEMSPMRAEIEARKKGEYKK